MRKSIYSFLIIASAGFLFSCGGGNVEELIVGNWTIEDASFENMDEIINAYKQYEGEMTEAQIKDFKADMQDDILGDIKGSVLDFKADNTVEIAGKEGTYSFNEDKTIIEASRGGDETLKFHINEIKASTFDMVLEIPEDDIVMKIRITGKKAETK